jgi:hypothetical protein
MDVSRPPGKLQGQVCHKNEIVDEQVSRSTRYAPRLPFQAQDQQRDCDPQQEAGGEMRIVAVGPEPQAEAKGQRKRTCGCEQASPTPNHIASKSRDLSWLARRYIAPSCCR